MQFWQLHIGDHSLIRCLNLLNELLLLISLFRAFHYLAPLYLIEHLPYLIVLYLGNLRR